MESRTSSKFVQILSPIVELAALERLEKSAHMLIMEEKLWLHCIPFMVAGNTNMHKSLDEFEIRSDPTTDYRPNNQINVLYHFRN